MWGPRLGPYRLAQLIAVRCYISVNKPPEPERVQSLSNRVILCHENEATGLEMPSRAPVTRFASTAIAVNEPTTPDHQCH